MKNDEATVMEKNGATEYWKIRTEEAWSFLCKILADEDLDWEQTFNLMLTLNGRFLEVTANFLKNVDAGQNAILLLKEHYIKMVNERIKE